MAEKGGVWYIQEFFANKSEIEMKCSMYIYANNTKVIFDVLRVSPIKISSKA